MSAMTDRYHHGDLPNALRAAAVDVITESGVGGFSLREVARRAGVSHNAPAHHFGDMTGLFTSLAVEGFIHLYEQTSAAVVDIDDPAACLVAIGHAYVDLAVAHPAHCQVMFRSDIVHEEDPALQDAGLAAYLVLRSVVERVLATEHCDLDVDVAARLCWSAMQGLVVLHPAMTHLDANVGRAPMSMSELVESFTNTIIAGWRTTSASA